MNAKFGAVLLILAGAVLGVIAVKNPAEMTTFVIATAGYFFTGIKYLYDNSEKVYVFVQRWRCVMLGLDTNWKFIARITTDDCFDMGEFKKRFLSFHGEGKRFISNVDGSVSVRCNDTTFDLIPDGDCIDIHVSNISVSYRMAESILEKRIGPVIELFLQGVKTKRATFFLEIKFLDENPFLGAYLRRVSSSDLKRFNVNFVIKSEVVDISKDQVTVSASTFTELISASRKVLALSPGGN